MTAAVVLAGGRSTRFGADKLDAEVAGRSLLARTIEAAAAAGCAPVVVVTARDVALAEEMVAVSELPRWAGPCAGLAAAIDALAGAPVDGDVVVLPADLADPAAALAALLACEGAGVLGDAGGHPQWLLARAPLVTLSERRRRLPDPAGRPASALLGGLPVVRARSPWITADIDRPADLDLAKEMHDAAV